MKKVIYSLGLALLLLIAGKASAELVCYQWSIFPFERFKLNILSHSLLTESDEEAKFRHPNNWFSVSMARWWVTAVVTPCGRSWVP